jgi:uncharacterized protein YbjT (DUF2867 family)
MKVFVAGATGAMGKRLVPQLLAAGYEVTAMTRSAAAHPASTTSPTTSRLRSRPGCPNSLPPSAPSPRATFRSGSAGWRPARLACP